MRFLLLLAPMVLIGCSPSATESILDAEKGQRMSCSAVKALENHEILSQIPLQCPNAEKTLTLATLRAAGWRVESALMGKEVMMNGKLASEITLELRKIF